jgi:hypothetical protein
MELMAKAWEKAANACERELKSKEAELRTLTGSNLQKT